jgi:hypothetical protein
MASVRADGVGSSHCAISGTTRVTARCPLAGSDLHEVVLFAAAEPYATHWGVGSLRVHNR